MHTVTLYTYCRTLRLKQLERLYRRTYERMAVRFAGGRQYGIDWPTLRVVAPSFHAALFAINAERRERVSAGNLW